MGLGCTCKDVSLLRMISVDGEDLEKIQLAGGRVLFGEHDILYYVKDDIFASIQE